MNQFEALSQFSAGVDRLGEFALRLQVVIAAALVVVVTAAVLLLLIAAVVLVEVAVKKDLSKKD